MLLVTGNLCRIFGVTIYVSYHTYLILWYRSINSRRPRQQSSSSICRSYLISYLTGIPSNSSDECQISVRCLRIEISLLRTSGFLRWNWVDQYQISVRYLTIEVSYLRTCGFLRWNGSLRVSCDVHTPINPLGTSEEKIGTRKVTITEGTLCVIGGWYKLVSELQCKE